MKKLFLTILGGIIITMVCFFVVIIYASYIFGFIGFLLLFLLKIWYIIIPLIIIIYFLLKNEQKN